MDEKMRKKGQVAIWVILGVVLVASLLLFFFLEKGDLDISGVSGEVFAMQEYLDGCTKDSISRVVDIMLPQGGFVNTGKSVFYDGRNVEYLCYYRGYFERCVQQHPVYMQELEREIIDNIYQDIEKCFLDMEKEFERGGGQFEYSASEPLGIGIRLLPDNIVVDIERDVVTKINGKTKKFKGLHSEIRNPLKNLATIAMKIAEQEANYCTFSSTGFGIYYPRYDVDHQMLSDKSEIYTIYDKKSEKEMVIAIRSCVIPAGLGLGNG